MTASPLQEGCNRHTVGTYFHFCRHLLGTIHSRYKVSQQMAWCVKTVDGGEVEM